MCSFGFSNIDISNVERISKRPMRYDNFLLLDKIVQETLEHHVIKTCVTHLEQGDSITLSIKKTANYTGFGPNCTERILRNNQAMSEFLTKRRKDRQRRKRGFN